MRPFRESDAETSLRRGASSNLRTTVDAPRSSSTRPEDPQRRPATETSPRDRFRSAADTRPPRTARRAEQRAADRPGARVCRRGDEREDPPRLRRRSDRRLDPHRAPSPVTLAGVEPPTRLTRDELRKSLGSPVVRRERRSRTRREFPEHSALDLAIERRTRFEKLGSNTRQPVETRDPEISRSDSSCSGMSMFGSPRGSRPRSQNSNFRTASGFWLRSPRERRARRRRRTRRAARSGEESRPPRRRHPDPGGSCGGRGRAS